MKKLQPPIEIEKKENEARVEYILTTSVSFTDEEHFTEVSMMIKAIIFGSTKRKVLT